MAKTKDLKLYANKNQAINAGCCAKHLFENNGVWYCDPKQIDLEDSIKELKTDGIKVTKEYKVKKTTK